MLLICVLDGCFPCGTRHSKNFDQYPDIAPYPDHTQTIITTALPTVVQYFHASEADYTWIGSAYLLAAAASTPTWGKFSDIWGRKPILLLANLIFFVGSLISALSINIRMLIGGRVIQGIGGGGLIILANICISDLFSMR